MKYLKYHNLNNKRFLNDTLKQVLEVVKAASWPSAKLREVRAAAPWEQSPATEHHRTGWPVCWKCGDVSHSEYPQRRDKELKNRVRNVTTKVPVSLSSFLCFMLNVRVKRNDNLYSEGQIEDRHCLGTTDMGHLWPSPDLISLQGCLTGTLFGCTVGRHPGGCEQLSETKFEGCPRGSNRVRSMPV
jgi:hypothetical protein